MCLVVMAGGRLISFVFVFYNSLIALDPLVSLGHLLHI